MQKESSSCHQVNGIDVLKDKKYHQIMSTRGSQKEPLVFWIDSSGSFPPDHRKESSGDCHLIEFFRDLDPTTTTNWGLSTKGRVVVGEVEMDACLVVSKGNVASVIFDSSIRK
jgi:hypothetical protein